MIRSTDQTRDVISAAAGRGLSLLLLLLLSGAPGSR